MVYFDNIDDYRDIELLNMYKERIDAGYDKKDIMKSIYEKGREMQEHQCSGMIVSMVDLVKLHRG